jgi:hypothetical protein
MAKKKGSTRLRNNKARLLKFLRYTNKLTAYQKFASRVGYMGAGFLIAAQWTIEPYTLYNRIYLRYGSNIIS